LLLVSAVGGFLEQAVKQRLVGAVVLAAIAVITLPIIFDVERPPSVQVPEVIPPVPVHQPVVTPEAKPVALPPDRPTEEPVPVADMYSMNHDPNPSAIADQRPVEPPPVAPPVPSAAANGKPVPAVPAARSGKLNAHGVPEAWVVQVAAMSEQKKIDALMADLKLRGYTVFSRTTQESKGKTTRIFVGPKLDKTQALKIKQQIDRDMKLQTMVKPFSPE
jgi:DedD protein